MTALTNSEFDYGDLEPDELEAIKEAEVELASSRKRVAEEMLHHGKILADAQSALANHSGGVFQSWLASQGITKTTAYKCIAAHKAFGSCPHVDNLEVSAMYALAENDKAKKKAEKLAANGVKVTNQMAKELIEASPPKPKADPPPAAKQPEPEWFQEIAEVYEDVDDEPEPEESVEDTRIKMQTAKTRKTFEAGLRAIGDMHELIPNSQLRKSMIDGCMKLLDDLKGWK